jgi:hypothetical protein
MGGVSSKEERRRGVAMTGDVGTVAPKKKSGSLLLPRRKLAVFIHDSGAPLSLAGDARKRAKSAGATRSDNDF